ncbi:glutathione peroxidase [Tunturiibacter gelidoferens]|uniref:Glutathione peroxidase n=1 Tax=Tunturiibacter gelidiferens TaxID=3069689 RepID=A0AAU7YVR7_9BACT
MLNPLVKKICAAYACSFVFFLLIDEIPAFGYQPQDAGRATGNDGKQKHPFKVGDTGGKPAKPDKTAYDYNLPGPDGKDVPLSSFKGKYILVVNLGRKSEYHAQLPALIKDAETFKDKGLVILGVPSNDFGAAEPGSDAEIQKAYADAKVSFPVMAVSKLSGDAEIPFYLYLTKSKGAPAGGPVHWNYTKFFIDKDGRIIARLDPDVTPDSPQMISTIGQVLEGRYKPKKEGGKEVAAGDDDDSE